ncbi:SNF2-related protein [Facklamia sp. P13069]|uniref:SNF2-related protein n=1 Tax=Facklamia sp. P13069 TaxID=3421954 RepID=UPI003D180BB7
MIGIIKLFPHQEQVLNETYEFDRVAYYLDMGLGKTFVGSQKLWELNTPYNIVVCQKSQINDWANHFRQHYDYDVVIYDKPKKVKPESIIIINYDKIWRRPELKKIKHFTLMLDESSLIQNEKTKRTKFILNLKPDNVILLSGTPTGGKYEKLYSQLKLLGWDISKTQYMKRYVDFKPNKYWGGIKILGYKNVDELKEKLREHGAVFMKTEEVYDLPDQNYVKVRCNLSKEYKEFNTHHIINYKNQQIVGDTSAVARINLRLFASVRNKNKMDRLKDLIDSTNDRLIIFYNYNEELETLKKLITDRPLSFIKGGLVDKKNYEECDDSITLVQYQAGSKGHNLQKANKIIYLSPPDSVENWMQSLKRVHRIGQERSVFYYQMITDDSIEYKIYSALERGVDYTNELFKQDFDWEE